MLCESFSSLFQTTVALNFGYDFPSTHHPHTQYSPHLPALLEINISVCGEEPLPVREFLLQHHGATKVASLLLFFDVFEPGTDTGSEHFARQDSGYFQIFKLIVYARGKILNSTNVEV